MALDPKTKKQLNDAIKTLSSLGSEFTGKARELVTLVYSLQQGLISMDENVSTLINDISSGKFEKENFGEYIKSLGIVGDKADRLRKIYEHISTIRSEELQSVSDYGNLLDEINKKENLRVDTSDELKMMSSDLLELLQQQFDVYSQSNDKLESQAEKVKRLLRDNQDFNDTLGLQVADYQDITDELLTMQSLVDNITGKEFTFNVDGQMKTFDRDEAIKYYQDIAQFQIDQINKEKEIRLDNLRQLVAEARGLTLDINTGEMFNDDGVQLFGSALNSATTKSEEMVAHIEDIVDNYIKTGEIQDGVIEQLGEGSRLLVEYLAQQKLILDTSTATFERATQNLHILGKYAPTLKAAVSASDELASGMQRIIDIIPKPLQELLGVDGFSETVHEGAVEAVGVFKNKLLETGSASQAVRASLASYGTALSGAVGIIGGIALALIGLFSITKMIEDSYTGLSEKLEISVVQAKELHKQNLNLATSSENQYLTLKDITNTQAEYLKSGGQIFDLMSKGGQATILRLGEISTAFGYSVGLATDLNKTFQKLGADKKISTDLQVMVGALSEAAKIAPEIVAKDLVNSVETVSTYFAGMPLQAAKTAIEVRRMGMSLQKAGELAERMLDMEGFMTDMFELAAMGGPDLSKAFDLGISGDIEGMTREVMNSIGSLQQFNEMDFLTRKKLADTMGQSTDELAKSLLLREKMSKASDEELQLLMSQTGSIEDIRGMSQEQLRQRLNDVQATKELSHTWEQIKLQFTKAILPLAEDFANGLVKMRPLLDGIVGLVRGIGIGLTWVYELIKLIVMPVQTVSSWFKDANESIKDTGTDVEKLGEQAQVAQLGIGSIGTALGVLATGGFILPKLTKMIKGVASGATSAYQTIKNLGGGSGGSITETITKTTPNVSETASKGSIGSGLVDRIKTMGSLVKKGLYEIGGMIQTGLQKLADLIRGGVNLLKDVFGGLVDIVSNAIKQIGSATGSLIKDILKGIGEGLESFSPKAIVGAAALTVMSGALYVSGHALQQFADVTWSDVSKGLVTLAALTGAASMLSSVTPMLLLGAVGIAAIGAALIPAAYAFGLFNDVEWESLAIAAAGITGLALAAAALSPFLPVMAAGSLVIGLLGASIIPFAYAMEKLNSVNLSDIGQGLRDLSGGLVSLTGGGIVSGLGTLFSGGSPFRQLGYLAEIAQPLSLAAESIKILSVSLMDLSSSLETLNLDKLKRLYDIKAKAETIKIDYQLESSKPKVGINQILPPSAESVAQNVLIKEGMSVTDSNQTTKMSPEQEIVRELSQGSSKKVEMLLTQLLYEMRSLNQRPIQIAFDDGTIKTVNKRLKTLNNNR